MVVTQEMIDKLEGIRKTYLQAHIVSLLAERLKITPEEAIETYFASDVAAMVDENIYGVCALDATYLADEILRQLSVEERYEDRQIAKL